MPHRRTADPFKFSIFLSGKLRREQGGTEDDAVILVYQVFFRMVEPHPFDVGYLALARRGRLTIGTVKARKYTTSLSTPGAG